MHVPVEHLSVILSNGWERKFKNQWNRQEAWVQESLKNTYGSDELAAKW